MVNRLLRRSRPERELLISLDPAIEPMRLLSAAARSRLADLETQYTTERHPVDFTRAKFFRSLQKYYQTRDRLRLIIDYRSKYLKTLLRVEEEEAEDVAEQYKKAKAQLDADYEEAATGAATRKELSKEQELELKNLWKNRVRLHHPGRFANPSDKTETYHRLTSEINFARENEDIELLREIANDPNDFI